MVAKLKLPDTEFLVLLDLAQRSGKDVQQFLADLIRDAAWREVAQRKDTQPEAAPCQ